MNLESNDRQVPFGRVAKFVRQLTHDVRNGLSAIDLQSAFLAELTTADPEAAEEVRKLRNMIANTARMLRDVSQNFQPVALHPMTWDGPTLVGEIEARLSRMAQGEDGLEFENRLAGNEAVRADLEQLWNAIAHVMRNALQFREGTEPVKVATFANEAGEWVLEFRQAKAAGFESALPPEEWGKEPLWSARPGGLGLGLFRANQILDAHGGRLETSLEGSELVTRLTLPLAADG